MSGLRVTDAGARPRPREPWVHGIAALIAPTAGGLLLGTFAPSLVLRTAALGVALTLVGAGLRRAVALGREEWMRDRPARAVYVGVLGRFVTAFLLVVIATS